MQRKSVKALIFSLVVFAAISAGPLFHSARAAGPKTPPVGLHVWTKSHAKISNPSDRLGGPLKVEVTQTNGSTRFIIPGPRALDPSVMGTPASPAGLEPAPFPLYGVPLKMRLKYKDQYSITNAAHPVLGLAGSRGGVGPDEPRRRHRHGRRPHEGQDRLRGQFQAPRRDALPGRRQEAHPARLCVSVLWRCGDQSNPPRGQRHRNEADAFRVRLRRVLGGGRCLPGRKTGEQGSLGPRHADRGGSGR